MVSVVTEAFCTMWLFLLGSAVGSFLNVVVYRLPRGMTLLGHSRCPVCGHAIAFFDNLPVFAWLLLRGRCRNCQGRISPRYPVVEFLAGATFVLLGVAIVALAAATLPHVDLPRYPGFAWQLFDPQPELIGFYAGLVLLLMCLLAAALVQLDGWSIPWSLVGSSWCVASILAVTRPSLPLANAPAIGSWGTAWRSESWWSMPAGLLVALLVGSVWQTGRIGIVCSPQGSTRSLLIGGAAGLSLGIHAALSMGLIVLMLDLVTRRWQASVSRHLLSTNLGVIFLAVLLHTTWWKFLAVIPGWPMPGRNLAPALLLLAAGIGANLVVDRRFQRCGEASDAL